jgi:hypothetical protein
MSHSAGKTLLKYGTQGSVTLLLLFSLKNKSRMENYIHEMILQEDLTGTG